MQSVERTAGLFIGGLIENGMTSPITLIYHNNLREAAKSYLFDGRATKGGGGGTGQATKKTFFEALTKNVATKLDRGHGF